jgi:SAM-dependent methyltransferase
VKFEDQTVGGEIDFRSRIYQGYATRRHEPLVPSDIGEFESRGPYLRALITRHFPSTRDAAILDLGCGSGALIHFARQAGYGHVAGVDRSPEQVAGARTLGIDGVREGDLIEALDELGPDSLDVVVAFHVVEHLTRIELLPLVDGVHRVLKAGGKWIIHTPNAESPLFGRIRYGDLTHELAFTRTSIGQLLFSSGFDSVSCFEDSPVVHGVMSGMRWMLWKLARGVLKFYLAIETGRLAEPAIFSQNFLVVAIKGDGAHRAS